MIAGRFIDELKINVEKSGPGPVRGVLHPVDNIPAWTC